jgi:dTDP-4-dehydrorhamnose 3,5-epimerase
MKTLSPKAWTNTDLVSAWEHAKAHSEPVFVPSVHFTDDRGYSIMNQMQGVMTAQGQVNYSVQYPGVIKAWHRHQLQTDFWMCLEGHVKFGCFRESDNTAWLAITGRQKPGLMIIPPTLWHGAATVGDERAGLFYYVTHAYNPAKPDEDRRAWDSVVVGGVGFPWGVRHG